MTAAPTKAARKAKPPAKRVPAAKKAVKTPAKKGPPPAKKAAKRAAPTKKRAPAGAAPSPGAAMRAELARAGDTVGITVLIRQAARVADRLENIDRVLSGDAKAWAVIGLPRIDDAGVATIVVRVDDLVREERSQTTVLRGLLAEIHRQRSGQPAGPGPKDDDDDMAVE